LVLKIKNEKGIIPGGKDRPEILDEGILCMCTKVKCDFVQHNQEIRDTINILEII